MRCATMQGALVLTIVILAAGSASAALVNFDFNGHVTGQPTPTTYGGNGVLRSDGSFNDNSAVGTSSGIWNGLDFSSGPNTPSPSSGFVDSSGITTAITLLFANWNFQDNCTACAYTNPGSSPTTQALLNDYIRATSPSGTPMLTIGGLRPNAIYPLIIYGTNGGSNAGGVWSVNGSPTQTTIANDPGTSGWNGTFTSGSDYVFFSVPTNGSGELVISGALQGGHVIFDGLQLIPEPTSLALLAFGAAGLLAIGRRRRRA